MHTAKILAQLIDGEYVRGFYVGPITTRRQFAQMSRESDGTMQHSWVEKDGKILDPTWWAFSDAKLSVYEFNVSDERYSRNSETRDERAARLGTDIEHA